MPLNDFLAALDTIKSRSDNCIVVLTGGEPLLRDDLELCGREVRKRGFRWGLVTNGYLYDEKRHNSLLNSGMGALTISLDGLKATHNWLRNDKDSFSKAERAISIAAASPRLNFDVVTCVNKKNINELDAIYNFLIARGVKAWRLFTISPSGRARDNDELFLDNTQFKYLMDYIQLNRKKKNLDLKFSCEGFVGKYELKVRDSYFFCRAGINIGSVLIDGSISACPNIDNRFSQGNIYTDNFNEIWQNRFELFRDHGWTKTGRCMNCRWFQDCQGNGLHNRQYGNENVLVCHNCKLQEK